MSAPEQYMLLQKELNETQWRHFLATEALKTGHGGINQVMIASGADWKTIKKGIQEIQQEAYYHPGDRIRKPGGGRKQSASTDTTLLADIDRVIDLKGNPMRFLTYTTASLVHLQASLEKLNHTIKKTALYNLLVTLRYRLTGNRKDDEGLSHPDRDQQFQWINTLCVVFARDGNPIISIDCKKKEQIGNFKNNGREWTKQGQTRRVNTYDFPSLAEGIAHPYGIYDRLKKQGFVNVGIDHNTASFAVESIRRWWNAYGKQQYPYATDILITADGGSSNGVRNRLFKKELQRLINEIRIPITLCHYPRGTSKWNVIEHQLFSYISMNWRAKPLTSLAVILGLISHTTTKSGLKVIAVADTNTYNIGIKVTDTEMKQLNIMRDVFHPEWNYTILPQSRIFTGCYL